jgi:hypothetical protein
MKLMELFYRVDTGTLIIRITRKSIHESVDLSDFWDELCLKISFICTRSDEEGTVLEKISEHTIFRDSTITDISIADIHRILRKNTISYTEGNLLIADHEPGMVPEIVIIETNEYSYHEEYTEPPCP